MAYSQQETKKCFLISLVFLLCCSPWQLVSAGKQIDHLPGFDGPLPFSLETGYVEVDEEKGVELFYYFVESERNPEKDPLLIWLTGGPGCSSLLGLTVGLGPLLFDLPNYVGGLPSINYKPNAWTQVSSVLFVDSPGGTGFSYSRTAEGLQTNDTESAHQLVHFLYKWLEDHPKFKSNPLYLAGTSYSGMVIPVLSLLIAKAKESHGAQFNFKGYVLGNPVTDDEFDLNARVPYYHGMALISDELFESTKKICAGNYVTAKNIHCAKYLDAVTEVTKDIYKEFILDPTCVINSSKPDQVPSRTIGRMSYIEVPLGSSNLNKGCRKALYQLSSFWANYDIVRDALGIRKGTIVDWHSCNTDTLPYTKDIKSALPYHRLVTSKGYAALIYSGDHDAEVPFIGTQAWIRSLNSSIVDDWRPWYSSGQVAGFTRRYSNNITFATVKGAGHTAEEYKTKECVDMLDRWLSGAPL